VANAILYDAVPSATTLIAADGALKNLAPAAIAITPELDPGLKTMADFELYLHDFAAAPAAGGYFSLYCLPKMDGTNYADGEDGDCAAPHLSANQLIGIFNVYAGDEDQRIPLTGIVLPPYPCKFAIVNNTSQAIANSDGSFLKAYVYSLEVQ